VRFKVTTPALNREIGAEVQPLRRARSHHRRRDEVGLGELERAPDLDDAIGEAVTIEVERQEGGQSNDLG